MDQFTALVKARTMEFVRDKGTFFWNLLFPVILVVGFSFAFGGEDTMFSIGTIGENNLKNAAVFSLDSVETISYDSDDDAAAIEKLRRHQIDLLVNFNTKEYYLNEEASASDVIRILISNDLKDFTEKSIEGDAIRYVDWVVPGIIGMNMLFSCMFGVGFVLVRYRKNGVLKRMKATPVRPLTFIKAQMASRFMIVLATSIIVFGGTNLFFHFMMNGSYLLLILITALSILCMISFGLIFAARLKSEELTSGLMNIMTFPMIIFSGVFFSLEGSPAIMQKLSKAVPLTHFIEGARSIMIDGAGIAEIAPHLLVLSVMTIVFLLTAALLFKWE